MNEENKKLFDDPQLQVLKQRRDELASQIGNPAEATPQQQAEMAAANQAMLERTVEITDPSVDRQE